MKLRPLLLLAAGVVFAGSFPLLRAQVVNDGATNTLANLTNTVIGDVTIGTNGSFTLLTLSNNSLLTNTVNGVIGRNATARSNEVRLITGSARWRMGNNLFVGSNGAFSRLVISNGALVENFNGVLANVVSSSNNVVLVTGAGTTWSNRGDLAIGFSGHDNQLTVGNGGFVFNRFGYLGQQPGGSNNVVRVTGSSSIWSNQFWLTVGGNSRSNRLIVEAGGLVTCSDGFVSGSSSSGNNDVLVTGPGSLWSNRFSLFMGDVAGRNRLVVSNGGTVWSGSSILGTLSPALSNQVIVTGPGSVWTNETSLSLGDGSPGNRVEVSNGGRLASNDGFIGQTLAANSNAVLLTGSGSAWNNRGTLIVGSSGSGNTLTASNGAIIAASNLFVGFTPNAAGNLVTVDSGALRVTNAAGSGVLDVRRGAVSLRAGLAEVDRLILTNAAGGFDLAGGTLITRGAAMTNIGGFSISGSATNPAIWDVRAGAAHALAVTLSVGSIFSFNQMLITNGGTLTSGIAYIGSNAGSSSNVALISGSGSKWTAANLDVGNGGAFNRLIVSNGATVEDFNGALGQNSGSSNNLAVVTGPGSLWSNRNEMYVGYQGSGNQLVISNGGTAFAQSTRFLGHASGAVSNNVAIVTGAGSRWLGPGNLEVGGPAALNQLLVLAGGLVANNFGFVGSGSDSSNNIAVIAGAGSTWSNAMEIHIGDNGDGNQLVVSNGGFVSAASGEIGSEIGSANNQVTVTGFGSRWTNSGIFYVGNYGVSNRLVIANGGAVYNEDGYIGGNDSSSNNLALVTGAGSVWSNTGSLLVGGSGTRNQLIVSNGASAFGYEGIVGYTASSSNNLAVVTGSGSVWSNAVDLFVGNDGRSNTLIIAAGGTVRGELGTVGLNATSSNNLAVVTDPGSVWSNIEDLHVGRAGANNRLVVSNGATVLNRVGEVGGGLGNSNLAVVTGAGSLWSNSLQLVVGRFGSGNRLAINNGGRVDSPIVTLGANVSSSNSAALVADSGSSWNVASSLTVGAASVGNRLVISNGASVQAVAATIGFAANGSNNEAVITSPGTTWTSQTLSVGGAGPRNRLVISNGGLVTASQTIVVGNFPGSTNNRVVVDTGALSVSNAAGTGVFDVRRGTNVLNAGLVDVDLLLLTNTPGRFEFNGGTLVTRGLIVSNSGSFTIGNAGSGPAVWQLFPGATDHFTDVQIIVGGAGSFAHMIHTNGALLTNTAFIDMGESAASRSNTFTLAGPASRCWMGDGVVIGRSGSDNLLVVRDGASIVTASISYLGYDGTSSNNEAVVTGPGTTWINSLNFGLRVGDSGPNNRLLVSDGALLASFDDIIGEKPGSSNNLAFVTGAGSTWTNRGELHVGFAGDGNQLVISNGGAVFGLNNRYIGYDNGAASNSVIVTDAGSRWLGNDSLYVGADGVFNGLLVRNGGQVTSGPGTIGGTSIGNNNRAVVTDTGSSWTNGQDLYVGELGSANLLVVSNSAVMAGAGHGFIGFNASARSNSVLVTDSGSRWLLSSNLYVGSNGAFSRLVIRNGARVQNTFGIVGEGVSSSNNAVIVTGSGSVWSNASQLHLGGRGAANQLVVSNGAIVHSVSGFLGGNTSSGGKNEAVITGAGSFWRSTGSLLVGTSTSGNRLVVTNGGWMFNSTANIGGLGEDNEVIVTGVGSTWTNGGTLIMGVSGRRSRLVVSDGGVVHEPFDLRMGENATSTNNRIVVDGGTLVMASPTSGLLDVRRGTNVLNAGLIYVGRILLVTNALGVFEFNGGTLQTGGTIHSNGGVFTVGNGASAATFQLLGGIHSFANDLVIASNAALTGHGVVAGVLTIQPGGRLSPGSPVGTLVLSNSPTLQGTTIMEIGNNGATYHDQIQVVGPLTYGGTLVISNTGPGTLAAGDRFRLFDASTYSGTFSSITLPPLPATLSWTNKLLVDGSIEILPNTPPPVELTIQINNGVLQVSWPTNGAAYCLETSYDLSPPVTWRTVSGGITTNNGSFVFALANVAASPKQFFRLAFPCAPVPLLLSLQTSGNLVTVSWPSNEFRLESTFNLAPPVAWQTITAGISSSSATRTFTFTNSPGISQQFFRLSYP